MAILMIGESPRLTADEYASVLAHLAPALRRAPGFLLHGACPLAEGGFRIVEVWRSKQESDQFFARHVAPNLPAGVRPKRRTLDLSSLLVASLAGAPSIDGADDAERPLSAEGEDAGSGAR